MCFDNQDNFAFDWWRYCGIESMTLYRNLLVSNFFVRQSKIVVEQCCLFGEGVEGDIFSVNFNS